MKLNIKNNNWFVLTIVFLLCLVFAYAIGSFGFYGYAFVFGLIGFFILTYLIFQNPFFGICLIVFCLPFERIPSIDIGIMNIKVNQIMGIALLFFWWLSFILNKAKIKNLTYFWVLIGFWTILGISILFGYGDTSRSLMTYGLVIFTSMFSILISQYLDTEDKLKKIIIILFWSSLLVGVFGIFQFMGDIVGLPNNLTGLREGYSKGVFGFPRIQAFSIEPLYLGNYLLIPLGVFISLFLANIKIKYLSRPVLLGNIILLTIIAILTFSRGAWVAYASMLAVLILFLIKKFLNIKIIILGIIALAIISGSVLWFINRGEDRSLEEFMTRITLSDATKSESVAGRITEYEKALTIFEQNGSPFFGVGLGAYHIVKHNYPAPSSVEDWDIVNNEYIEMLVETGYIGLISFVLLLILIIWKSIVVFYRSKSMLVKYITIGFLAAFIGVLVQYNFFSTLYIIHIWVLIGLLLAMQNLAQEKS